MRRRLWWQFAFFDERTANLCGSRPSLDLQGDTRPPLNINDSDLSPGMTHPPKERSEITEMAFCMTKFQVGDFLRRTIPLHPMSIDGLRRSSMSLLCKDEVINKLQDSLEQRFLRHCDPLQPLHLLCSIFCRIAICKLRLSVHNPFPHGEQGVSTPQSESDLIFDNGMKVIGYGIMLYSAPNLRRYQWFLGANFVWDSFIYTLIELRHRKTGRRVDHAWTQIAQLFQNIPQVLTESGNPLYAAVGIWTLKVWEECSAAREGVALSKTPDFINQLRCNRTKVNGTYPDYPSTVPPDPMIVGGSLLSYDRADFWNQPLDGTLNAPYEGTDSFNTSYMLSPQPYLTDWAQLDHIIRGTES